jgi:hypothetical protein
MTGEVLIGASDGDLVCQPGDMSNRQGSIAGATGIAQPGRPHKEIDRRLGLIPVGDYQQRGYPTLLWDIFGEHGHPVRTTISEMGPLILSNLLELNDTQTGVLYACFAIADAEGLLLLDLKDLRALLAWMSDNRQRLQGTYGNLAPASIAPIQRRLLVLEQQGAERFFGEPSVTGAAHSGQPPGVAHRPAHSGRTCCSAGPLTPQGPLRHGPRPRVGLRNAGGPRPSGSRMGSRTRSRSRSKVSPREGGKAGEKAQPAPGGSAKPC